MNINERRKKSKLLHRIDISQFRKGTDVLEHQLRRFMMVFRGKKKHMDQS